LLPEEEHLGNQRIDPERIPEDGVG